MYTQCPECGTVFRVTAAVLRAAQGQVRCGVCDANFDALRFLSDAADGEPAAGAAGATLDAGGADAAATEAPAIERAAEILPAASEASAAPATPHAAPDSPASAGAATRTTPSVDEGRALAEIAAALARRPVVAAPAATPGEAQPAAAEDNILEPSEVEDIVLGGEAGADSDFDEIPDSALEFNAPPAEWDRVFVPDTTITPLDVNLEPLDAGALGTATESSLDPVFAAAAVSAAPRISGDDADPLARTDEFQVLDLELLDTPLAATLMPHDAGPPPVPSTASAASAAAEPAAPEPAPLTVAPATAGEPRVAAELRPERAAPPAEPDEAAAAGPAPARRAALVAFARAAGVAVLGLLLAAQVIHHYREPLIANSTLGPQLAALYARLGQAIEPRWDLAAYDVKQWGAGSDVAPGALRLRASVVNRARRSQPYPLLRVTLEDRFGGRVAQREFTPSEYLPGHVSPAGMLGPGARADADLALFDPGSQAVGFELDVCLMRAGRLVCGVDQKPADGG